MTTNTTQEELLPCPHCGSQATLLEQRIACDVCLAEMHKLKDETIESLIEAWNRRTPPAEQPAAEGMTDAETWPEPTLIEQVQCFINSVRYDTNSLMTGSQTTAAIAESLDIAADDMEAHLASKRDGEAFPYHETFNAIGDAVRIEGTNLAISVIKFRESFARRMAAHPPANQGADQFRDATNMIEKATGSGELPALQGQLKADIESLCSFVVPDRLRQRLEAEKIVSQIEAYARQAIAQCGDRRDALRYRVLSRCCNNHMIAPISVSEFDTVSWNTICSSDELDAAIDAIAKGQNVKTTL